jgi:hypothetical protein
MECTCKFVAVGEPMDNQGCLVHTKDKYGCDLCKCRNYRPVRERMEGTPIPWCSCGHPAGDHN